MKWVRKVYLATRLSPLEIADKTKEQDRSVNKIKKADRTQKIQNKNQAPIYQLTMTRESDTGFSEVALTNSVSPKSQS